MMSKKKHATNLNAESLTKSSAYARAGVDIETADSFVSVIGGLVKKTLNKNVCKSIGGYAALYKISKNQFIAASTDGVGTKLKIAFDLNKHHTVGIDLVAMSVNDLICVGAKPLFFLDYFATGKLKLETSTQVITGIVEGCRQAKIALIGGETAEMPGFYAKGEYDLAGFAVGLVDKSQILGATRVRPGDALIAVASSGPHSNGFSLIRNLISSSEIELIEKCFAPTKIYVDAFFKLQAKLGLDLHGLAHITGSGFLNIPRINEDLVYNIDYQSIGQIPEIFHELKKRGKLSYEELFTTFNSGVGLVVAVSQKSIGKTIQILKQSGHRAWHFGEARKKKKSEKTSVNIRIATENFQLKY